ncbi:MAG: hypothetical protein FJ398_23505 [Verrucomicrobia bacterium]|nr:hypothetical protein [Verrucomicrobiota bacterium]
MRILHTEWSDGWGGQERRVLSEMTGMNARGHFVALATRPQCRLRVQAEAAGIPVLTLPRRAGLRLDPSAAAIFVRAAHRGREYAQRRR